MDVIQRGRGPGPGGFKIVVCGDCLAHRMRSAGIYIYMHFVTIEGPKGHRVEYCQFCPGFALVRNTLIKIWTAPRPD
jgi:hypothetical protein